MRLTTSSKFLSLLLLFSVCLNVSANPAPCAPIDPYEKFNRRVFSFNQSVDRFILKPVATLYVKIVPCPLAKGINNVFNNLNEVTTIPNDILQGNLYYTAADTTRFAINSTFGLGGLIDVASYGHLPNHVEDTGLTFAKWGYKPSAYVMLPFVGSSTVRDTLGLPFDYFVFSAYPFIPTRCGIRIAASSLYFIDRRAQFLPFDDAINSASVDPYVFVRDAYLQRRNFLIAANLDRCNNPNIQNENVVTTVENTNNDDIYVPASPSASKQPVINDPDDIYVPADTQTSSNKAKSSTNKSAQTITANNSSKLPLNPTHGLFNPLLARADQQSAPATNVAR